MPGWKNEMEQSSLRALVAKYMKKVLPDRLCDGTDLTDLSPEAQQVLIRAIKLMKHARYCATNFNPILIRWLTTTIPSILPSAWNGRIPPITIPNRHRILDEYVAVLCRDALDEPHGFIDVGCGFPPVTSADTAKTFKKWRVFGVDQSFAEYVLYDPDGNYACFDQRGRFLYFQAMLTTKSRAFYADPNAARQHFTALFSRLTPLLSNKRGRKSATVEHNGWKLIYNHIRDFETHNLTFIQSEIENAQISPAKVIRCMNVLIYFRPEIRENMRKAMAKLLDVDGVMIIGTNGLGIQIRYHVYRKTAHSSTPTEFAFSLDNLGHVVFMPWLAFFDYDPEAMLLAKLASIVRADTDFWPDFSQRLDTLLKTHGICERWTDGYFRPIDDDMPPEIFINNNSLLWQQIQEDGYVDGVVEVLKNSGYNAWKNPVGHIAIEPVA